MASITVTEYSNVARDADGNVILAGREPNIAVQDVASAGVSTAFSGSTTMVMITSTANQRILFSKDGDQAILTDMLIVGGERFFGVFPGYHVSNLDAP